MTIHKNLTYLLSTYNLPNPVTGTRCTYENKTDTILPSWSLRSVRWELVLKQDDFRFQVNEEMAQVKEMEEKAVGEVSLGK